MKKKNSTAIRMVLHDYWVEMKHKPVTSGVAMLLPGVGTILITYAPPIVIAKMLAEFGKGGFTNFNQFIPYILVFMALWASGQIIWRIAIQANIIYQRHGIAHLYNKAFKAIINKDMAFFDNSFVGSLTKQMIGYARNFEGFTDTIAFSVSANFLPIIFVAVILGHYSWTLVYALFGLVILTALMLIPLIRRRQKLVVAREKASNVLAGNISDAMGNMSSIRTYAREADEIEQNRRNVEDFLDKTKATWDYQNLRVEALLSPMFVIINTAGLVLALMLSQNGVFNFEAIFIAFSYYASFTQVIWEFHNIYRSLESNVTDAAQFTELLLTSAKVADPSKPAVFNPRKPALKLHNVSFHYSDNKGEHLFKDLNVSIKAGEKIGLVGPSGGGKTTIAKLMMRLMDVDAGEITIDGINIADIKQTDLHSYIGYVPQDPALFHRSLAENIRYGKSNASHQQVAEAAKLANADEFIANLFEGYNTLVGERGVKLSGGQRQRVVIARAILKDAPILVLDEATSALDSESEGLIQNALTNLMEGRTAIVIAHRLSTIQKMDRILVLEDGVITEQGSHKELLELNGHYAKLWAHQSGGFLED